jgi:hypothetical protein
MAAIELLPAPTLLPVLKGLSVLDGEGEMTVLLPPEGTGYLKDELVTRRNQVGIMTAYPDPDGPDG